MIRFRNSIPLACRSFTPILAELYTIIKEAYPSHGLEIVFVSSDRDEQSFNQYFRTMPWLALPFDDSLRTSKQRLSAKYHVKGIPSLVVLDSISGQIVIPNTESRSLVMQTVQCGADKAIADMFSTAWLDRIPFESKEILSMLATSCRYETVGQEIVSTSPKVTSFLLRSTYIEKQQRIEMLTAQLIDEEEMDPDQAKEAAFAVEALVGEADTENRSASRLNECFLSKISDLSTDCEMSRSPSDVAKNVSNASREQLKSVLVTLWKYFLMCYETPWISKFRQFQLSFKVADRITVVPGGLELAESLGFQILFADFDFVASVPVSADLHEMKESIRKLCIQFDVCT
jgi:Thioredoxin-like